jgi:uncharacterized protein (UPF0264 family)
VAKLLVSVRSAIEAETAVAGGAAIIDVKEPSRGPLGRADCSTWHEVRSVVPGSIPVTVALGELKEWLSPDHVALSAASWRGIALYKIGLSHAGPDWRDQWNEIRPCLDDRWGASPARVAVVYLDWGRAQAPDPDAVVRAALEARDCQGVLFDTWDKSRRTRFDLSWRRHIASVRDSGRFVALAGSLDAEAIRRLRPLDPEVFAVRGAACRAGERGGVIDRQRVAELVAAALG